jgi:hypothetical protein
MDNRDTIGASAPGGPSHGITDLLSGASKAPAETPVIPGGASITNWNNGKISDAGSSGSLGSHLAAYITAQAIDALSGTIGSFSEAFNIGAPSDHRGFALFPVLGKLICADEACRRVIQNKLNDIPFDTEKVAHMR